MAMNQVSAPVIAVGLVLTAVFVPCAFITGITGQFYRQFALTIATSTVISAFNSLTLQPGAGGALAAAAAEGGVPGAAVAGVRGGRRLGGLCASGPATARAGRSRRVAARHCLALARAWPRTWSGLAVGRPGRLAGQRPAQPHPRLDLLPVQQGVRRGDGGLHPDGRRAAAGQRAGAAALRRPAGPDLLGLHPDAHRVHPAAGQGLPAGQRPAARLVVARADPEGDEAESSGSPASCRASRTPWRSPASRSC